MSKKPTKKQDDNDSIYIGMTEQEFFASHVIEDPDHEALCPCGETISSLGCGKIACDEEKPEQAQFLPIPGFVCKIKD